MWRKGEGGKGRKMHQFGIMLDRRRVWCFFFFFLGWLLLFAGRTGTRTGISIELWNCGVHPSKLTYLHP